MEEAQRGGGAGGGRSAARARVGTGAAAWSRRGRGQRAAAPLAFLLQVAQNFAPWLLADCIPHRRLP
jgi:hypothetical protein